MSKSILAWHFVGETLRNGAPIPDDGVTLVFGGEPILCSQGFHASVDAFDALEYAPGNTLCRVRCGGIIKHDKDKLVCTERAIIASMDATEMLRYFARMQALSVIDNYPNDTDQIVFDYLMTGEEGLRLAAYSAAESAAASAAWSAAASAAYLAAMSAAYLAAELAAWSATGAAARAEFNSLVHECFGISKKRK